MFAIKISKIFTKHEYLFPTIFHDRKEAEDQVKKMNHKYSTYEIITL